MKRRWGLKLLLSAMGLFLFITLVTKCSKVEDIYQAEEETINSSDYFDFSTVKSRTLTLDLGVPGATIFYLYEENPTVELEDGSLMLSQEKMPIYADVTDEAGTYSGSLTLPAYLTKAWLVAEHVYLPLVLEMEPSSGNLTYTRGKSLATISAQSRAVMEGVTYPNGYSTLGGWDATGIPDYLLKTPVAIPAAFLKRCNQVYKSIAKNYKAYNLEGSFWQLNPSFKSSGTNDMVVIKNTSLVATYFASESTVWKNMIAYYTYQEGETVTQASLATMRKTILFPRYDKDAPASLAGKQVQLKYWNKETNSYQDEFPAGTHIGWIVLGDGFGNLNPKLRYSNPAFNLLQNDGVTRMQHSILMVDPELDNCFFMAMEDNNDFRFNDALFAIMSSTPSSIKQPPVIPDPVEPGEISYKVSGTLAFEDYWPSRGDYDMNDVVLYFTSTVSKMASGDKRLTRTTTTFTPINDGATYTNGFGFQLDHVARGRIDSLAMSQNGQLIDARFEVGANKPTVILFDDMRAVLNKPMVVDIVYKTQGLAVTEAEALPPYNPFIFVNNREHEVHLTGYQSTSKADDSLRGTQDDLRGDKKGEAMYYVSKDNMPFAIYLSGVHFNYPDERQDIRNKYPQFSLWAKSFGAQYLDWYK